MLRMCDIQKHMRSVPFWVIKQRRVVIFYRRFVITYRSHFKGEEFQNINI
jgi:hypothetical protein